MRRHNAHFTGLYAAQEARRAGQARADDNAYASDGASRFQSAAIVDTSTPAARTSPATPLAAVQPGTNKYRAKPTNGYASKKEANRALQLALMRDAGQIRNIREQVDYLLIPPAKDANGKLIERSCSYRADFVYEEWPTWNTVVEDCKGMRTDAYVIKRKLMYFVHGIRVRET